MIIIENVTVAGWEPAIRGMRNPMNSWAASDSVNGIIGPKDADLMKRLISAGTPDRKFLRMITVWCDITAPSGLWWPEFDTYKVGTVRNSCSKMHKLHSRDLTREDFSTDNLDDEGLVTLDHTIAAINRYRALYNTTHEKQYWRRMLELLPISYNQRSTVMMNYEVLRNMYFTRRYHKLQEWRDFCAWIETLPNSWLITMEVER